MIALVVVGSVALVLAGPLVWLLKGRVPDPMDFAQLVLLLIAMAGVAYGMQIERTTRLTLSDDGCRLESRFPAWLKWAAALTNWSAAWPDIKHVALMGRNQVLVFTVRGRGITARLPLQGWVHAHLAGDGLAPVENTRSLELDRNPLWQELLRRGYPMRAHGTSILDFNLVTHPATRRALIGCALLGGGGLLALVLARETYIADGYGFLLPHALGGGFALALFWWWLARVREPVKLPIGIAPGLAAVAAAAGGLFSYGVLPHVNMVVAPALPAAYTIGSPCTTLVPVDAGMPRIIWYPGFSDYWCQFGEGTSFMIPVRAGLFGVHQFDQQHYVDLIWEWRDAEKDKAR